MVIRSGFSSDHRRSAMLCIVQFKLYIPNSEPSCASFHVLLRWSPLFSTSLWSIIGLDESLLQVENPKFTERSP